MSSRSVRELRDLSDAEVRARLRELHAELFPMRERFRLGGGISRGARTDTMLLRNTRKEIARCLTILRERELKRDLG